MANNKKEAPKVQYVEYNSVSDHIKRGEANIGVVVHANVDGRDNQFLIISNNNSEIIDVVNLTGKKTLSFDDSIMIFGQDSLLDSRYYAKNGKAYELKSEIIDQATLSAMYDGNFGMITGGLTAYEHREVCTQALQSLDNALLHDTTAIREYLQRVESAYLIERIEARHAEQIVGGNNYDQAARLERTTEAILNSQAEGSLNAQMRSFANETYVTHISSHLTEMSEQKMSGYSNELQRAVAEHHMDMDTMKLRYLELSQDIVKTHEAQLKQDGIIDCIGKTDETSYKKIQEVVQQKRAELDDYIYNGGSSSGIIERQRYLSDLVELSASHIYHVEAQPSNKGWHFATDSSIYEATTSHMLGRGAETTYSLDHAVVSYQGKTQREMYEYLCDKSAIIEEIAKNYQKYAGRLQENADTMSLSERRDRVADEICQQVRATGGNAHIYETSKVHDFLQSDEFVKMLSNKSALFIDDKTLRPEYSVQYHKYSMSAYAIEFERNGHQVKIPACRELQNAIEAALSKENELHTRHSQDLLAARDFVRDYIQYNQAANNATFNHTMATGLNVQQITYSYETLNQLNEVYTRNPKAFDMLREGGFTVDFKSIGNSQQVHANYDALTYGFDSIASKKLNEAIQDIAKQTGLTVDSGSWSRLAQQEEALQTSSPAERAKIIKEAITGVEGVDISRRDVAILNKHITSELVSELSTIREAQQSVEKFRLSLADDLRQDVQLTRGCDNLYARDAMSGAFSGEQYRASTNALDFATALASSPSRNSQEVVMQVIENHQLRNEMIDRIQSQLDNPDAKRAMFERIAQTHTAMYEELNATKAAFEQKKVEFEESSRTITDPKKLEELKQKFEADEKKYNQDVARITADITRDAPAKIAAAYGIDLSEKSSEKLAILSSADFVAEFEKAAKVAKKENVNLIDSAYVLTLEKTGGLDALQTLVINQGKSPDKTIQNLDYTRLADSSYLDYLRETTESSFVRDNIEKFQRANSYTEVLVVARNVEELTHGAEITPAARERIAAMADQIAYRNAVEHDPETSKITYRKYAELLSNAQGEATSEYMQAKIARAESTISTAAQNLKENVNLLFAEHTPVQGMVAFDNKAVATAVVRDAIRDDDKLFSLRSRIEDEIKSSPHYEDFVKLNNNSEIRIRIANIESEIQAKMDLIKINETVMREHEAKAHGLGKLKWGAWIEGDKANISFYQEQISGLKLEREELYQQLAGKTEVVPESINNAVMAYRKANNVENAEELARQIIKNYGHEQPGANVDGYSIHKLNDALRDIQVPYAAREDYNNVRLTLIDAAKDAYVERANAMVKEHITQVIHQIDPHFKGSEMSPQSVDKMIEAATTDAEKARLTGLRDQLATLQGMTFTKENIDDNITSLIAVDKNASQLVGQISHLNALQAEAQAEADSLTKFKAALSAYESIEQIRSETSMMSSNARAHAADVALEAPSTARYTQVVEELNKVNVELAQAFEAVHKSQTQINKLLERLDNGEKITTADLPALEQIARLNAAIQNVKPEDQLAISQTISTQLSGSFEHAHIIKEYVFSELQAEKLGEYTKSITTARELIDEVKNMDEEQRTAVVTVALKGTDHEAEQKALLILSQHGCISSIDLGEQQKFFEEARKSVAIHGAEHLETGRIVDAEVSAESIKLCPDKVKTNTPEDDLGVSDSHIKE